MYNSSSDTPKTSVSKNIVSSSPIFHHLSLDRVLITLHHLLFISVVYKWITFLHGSTFRDRQGKLTLPGITKGFFGYSRDAYDDQWRNLRSSFPILCVLIVVHVLISQYIGRRSFFLRRLVNLVFGIIFTLYMHGFYIIHIIAISSLNFGLSWLSCKTASIVPFCLWVFQFLIFLTMFLTKGIPFTNIPYLSFLHDLLPVNSRWYIHYGFLCLKQLSFGLDLYWKIIKKESCNMSMATQGMYNLMHSQDSSKFLQSHSYISLTSVSFCSFSYFNYLTYIFYLPLYLAGPICSYNSFMWQLAFSSDDFIKNNNIRNIINASHHNNETNSYNFDVDNSDEACVIGSQNTSASPSSPDANSISNNNNNRTTSTTTTATAIVDDNDNGDDDNELQKLNNEQFSLNTSPSKTQSTREIIKAMDTSFHASLFHRFYYVTSSNFSSIFQWYVVRKFLFVLISFEFFTYLIPINSLISCPVSSRKLLWPSVPWYLLCTSTHLNLCYIWLKFTVLWRFFRIWSLLDNVYVVENQRSCIYEASSISFFWRQWHASYNTFIIRYLYKPLGGIKLKPLLSFLIFCFVALWHEFNYKMLGWGSFFSIGLCLETVLSQWFNGYIEKNGLSDFLFLPTVFWKILFRAVSIVWLIYGNLVGFSFGLDGLLDLVRFNELRVHNNFSFVFVSFVYIGFELFVTVRIAYNYYFHNNDHLNSSTSANNNTTTNNIQS